ncbi:restriction endonuclease subunit S [Weeksella virosa]|uniref:restriction endonuclease subunit S n=1 Tax=Weeksella virosa TaxID=1014 RepID=UPI0025566ED6|nr:restriction endonuclease subunit S [Weeksella virosa]MDK7374808.1 restriction endonuclease subunit S [Weeksella virosa]
MMENRNWKEYRFSDFVKINPSVTLKANEEYSFVEMKDLEDGNKYCFPKIKKIKGGGAKFQNGDTLFARITPCLENGKICQVKGLENNLGFGSTEFYVFRGKENISDTEFVYYLSRWNDVRDHAEINLDGTSGRQRVPKASFDDLIIQMPGLPEQKAIASVLSSLDDKIDLLHQQNQTLEALAETLFRQWFIERCPEPVEGEAKEDWEERPLSSIANFLNGLACQKFPPKDSINRLPVLKIKDLTSGISENSDWATTDVKPEYIIRNGDVIFAWSASLMVKIWNGEDCILNQHLFKVTSEEFPKWFYYFWCKQHLREFISIAQSHATTMGHIKRSDLDEAMVLIPEEKEIEQMTIQMNPILEKIQLNNNQINSLSKLRDTLLPKLMSGEVRVKL